MIIYSTVLQTGENLTRDILLKNIFYRVHPTQINKLIKSLPKSGVKSMRSRDLRKKLIIICIKEQKLTAVRYRIHKNEGYILTKDFILDEISHSLFIQEDINKTYDRKISKHALKPSTLAMIHHMMQLNLLVDNHSTPIRDQSACITKDNINLHSSFDQIYEVTTSEAIRRSKINSQKAKLAQAKAEEKYKQLLSHLDEERETLNKTALEKALEEADILVSSYEEDIEALRDEIYEKNLLIQGLEIENQRLKSRFDTGKIPLIYFGQEKEFYLGEIQDLLLSTLEDALEQIPVKTRKHDIISDIIHTNNYRHITKDRNEQVKRILKGYDGMTSKVRHDLEELGFQIEQTNKHCKISYHGDNRYLAIFGSTPSDIRSGKNNAATLIKMAY